MIESVNLADVRALVLVVQQGNFTKAAEALGVSRSHVSRQISSLEAKLGVTLVIRTTRTLRLTDAGSTLYKQCAAALGDIDNALLNTIDEINSIKGELRVNCVGGYLGEELIADIANDYLSQYPEVSLKLDFSSHRVDLIDDDFDVAFRMGKLDDSGFVARKLADINIVTLASRDYLARKGRPQHPRELNDHQCITGSVTRWRFLHNDGQQTYELNVSGPLACKNGRVLVKAATAGQGIIRVPEVYCREELKQGLLVEVFEDWKIPSVDFSMLYHRDRFQPKRIRAFIEHVTVSFARRRAVRFISS
ncbi:LysR family transcriptional regulator [Vibrio sp. WXL210]|uniref:LysR family transcriptional regulator n=1 Tax=Vibrio sp. WXL210 TaxID=3450709 RepID=UPI003EC7F872